MILLDLYYYFLVIVCTALGAEHQYMATMSLRSVNRIKMCVKVYESPQAMPSLWYLLANRDRVGMVLTFSTLLATMITKHKRAFYCWYFRTYVIHWHQAMYLRSLSMVLSVFGCWNSQYAPAVSTSTIFCRINAPAWINTPLTFEFTCPYLRNY